MMKTIILYLLQFNPLCVLNYTCYALVNYVIEAIFLIANRLNMKILC